MAGRYKRLLASSTERPYRQANDVSLPALEVLLMCSAIWVALVARLRGRQLASPHPVPAPLGELPLVNRAVSLQKSCVPA